MENGKLSTISIDMKSKATQTKGILIRLLIWYLLCLYISSNKENIHI